MAKEYYLVPANWKPTITKKKGELYFNGVNQYSVKKLIRIDDTYKIYTEISNDEPSHPITIKKVANKNMGKYSERY